MARHAKQSREEAIVQAAERWVDSLQSHPNLWGTDEDFAIIEAVTGRTDWAPGQSYPKSKS